MTSLVTAWALCEDETRAKVIASIHEGRSGDKLCEITHFILRTTLMGRDYNSCYTENNYYILEELTQFWHINGTQ